MSAVGVVITGGAADEKAHLGTVGGAQLAEVCAWRGTRNSSTADVLKRAEACGAYLHANAQREQTLYCIDALRDKLEDATQLLAEACLLGPDLEAPGAMDEVREGMELAFLDATQVWSRRPCLSTASGDGRIDATPRAGRARPGKHPRRGLRFITVGRAAPLPAVPAAHFVPKNARGLPSIDHATAIVGRRGRGRGTRRTYCIGRKALRAAPAAANDKATDRPVALSGRVRPRRGARADARRLCCGGDAAGADCVRHARARRRVAFEGFDRVLRLADIVGRRRFFSAGGPGKGMYSRLYREVLNRYHWVEACEAFVSIHDREGLLGIVGACAPASAHHLTEVLMSNLLRLGQQPVERSELDRAKNMLKVNVLTQLESRLVLFEDIARQVATFGRRQTLQEMTAAVDAVTEEDILRIGQYMCAAPPSMAAHGETRPGCRPTSRCGPGGSG